MKIGVIGAGAIGGLIGKLWAEAGHEVFFSSRNPQNLNELVSKIKGKAYAGTVKEACTFADTFLLAINYATLDEALDQMENISGKLIMDTTNPYAWNTTGGLERTLPKNLSGGEVLS
ncbi:MAG: NAD(P)-binding domain-containing protein [Bacteroidota bacterium]